MTAALGKPVVTPSANHSVHVSPTAADHIRADLRGHVNIILDGVHTEVGVVSTIIACFGVPTLLRPGSLPREARAEVLGPPLENREAPALSGADDASAALGMLESHYAPRAQLRMNAASAVAGEAFLAFGPDVPNVLFADGTCLNCSAGSDLVEAAVNLFPHLRALETSGAAAIAVMPVPEQGLGEAINDRLRRAAAPCEIR